MSLFPFATTEDLTLADQEVTASSIREYEIDFEKGTLTGRIVTGVDALCVWAYLALKAKRYRWIIYSWGYGDEVYDLIGYSYSEEYLNSEVLRQLKEFKEIAKAETPELKYILEQIERTLNNMFIETADEYGIKRFEDMMGIYPEAGASLETRRFNVLVKWNDKVPYTEKELYNRLISICGDDNFSVNPDYKNYFVEIITHLGIEGAFDTISSILQDMIPCNLVLDLKNTLEEGNTTPFSVAVVSCVAMRYQITNDINPKVATESPMYYGVGLGRAGTHIITHDIKSTVNQSSDLSIAQALSTGGSSGAITMDIAVKDEVESPHYEGVGVGMAFTKIITHDINSKATNSGNTTVAKE